MASNLFSRFGTPSDADVERAGLTLDEDNLNQNFHDYDLDGVGMDDSRLTVEPPSQPLADVPTVLSAAAAARRAGQAGRGPSRSRSRRSRRSRWGGPDDDADDDVPGSLLVEHQGPGTAQIPPLLKAEPLRADNGDSHNGHDRRPRPSPIPGPSTRTSRAQWETARDQQRLYDDGPLRTSTARQFGTKSTAYDRAMWRWVNVSNLDNFIRDVYDYYRDSGFRCIMLARFLHLVNVAFVAVFLTFLTQCVDYGSGRGNTRLEQVLVPQCTKHMSWTWNAGLWLFAFYFVWKTMQFFLFDVRRLLHLRDFFVHLLGIPEHDMQTVSWQDVVVKIMALRDQNPKTATNMTRRQREWIGSQSKERLDAHDMANRLMRRENYLIALFNKDILDLRVPLPYIGRAPLLTRTLEWTLWFAVIEFVFDERGQVSQDFLRAGRRGQLSSRLRSRFLFAGFMNLLLAPFVACYLVVVYFLTYYNEYQKNPSALGARAYTPLAEWTFREFNELEHLFHERLNMSCPFATRYLDQFPKRKTEQVARTVTFIAGALWTVLAIAMLLDPDPLFLSMEVTRGHTVLFYVGVFASVWAAARGMITEDNSVFDPEYALRNVIEYTHYEPDHWRTRLHSADVKAEFAELYQLKIRIFFDEILSILLTPLILFTSLPRSSDQIVDFFREFTVHVDGLGYVCSFAVFDFHKGVGASAKPDVAPISDTRDAHDARDDYYATKHGKMAASYYNFLDNYVINPKTGIPGHNPPGRHHPHHHHHPPPPFPGLNSPTLGPDLRGSHLRHRPHAQPMASVLLDPHHQPSHLVASRARPGPGPSPAARFASGESFVADGPSHAPGHASSEGLGLLEESAWQTAPPAGLSREGIDANADADADGPGDADVGVLGLMYQFQQATQKHRGSLV